MKTWESIAIVGVGLIGGSVGLAVRQRHPAARVVGCGSRQSTLEDALRIGAITAIAPDVAQAVSAVELVVVCAPVENIIAQVRELAAACRPGTLITDAGSTKEAIVEALSEAAANDAAWPPEVRFLGSHPMAGNEKKGPRHASADLFEGRSVIITPTADSRAQDCQAIGEFWQSLGARTVEMSPEEHDRVVAAISHFPHLAAAAIALSTPADYVALSAGGWQDTTRIAGGDPQLWRQILLTNRGNVLALLYRFGNLLADWRQALEANDAEAVERLLAEAKRIRDRVES